MKKPDTLKQLPPESSKNSDNNKARSLKLRNFFTLAILSTILFVIWMIGQLNKSQNIEQNSSNSIDKFKQGENEDVVPVTEGRFSLGEKILIGADDNPSKQSAIEEFAQGDFRKAYTEFLNSLETNSNDPETLIYANNSKAAINDDSILIGVVVPIGASLNIAQEILRGVAQAQDEINEQGGIEQDGIKKKIRIKIANDDNDPKIARQIAKILVADPEIKAVIGHNSSTASIAAAPVYQEGNLVMVSPTSVARELSQAGNYIFRTTPSSRILAEMLAEYAVEDIKRQDIAICADSTSSASESFKEDFSLAVLELGGEVSNTSCDFSSPDFNSDEIPSKAIANGAEALLLAPSVDKINQALEVSKANQKRLVILGNHSLYTYETLKFGQDSLNGTVIPTVWHPSSTSGSAYNTKAVELWGKAGSWRTATAYDATKAIVAALESSATRAQLQKSLANSGFSASGALGKIVFQPSGDRHVLGTLVKVQPGKSSGTGFDFKTIESSNQ